MKGISLTVFAVAVVSLVSPAQAAPSDSWCRDMGIARGSVQVCSAYTFNQCMASRTSHTETCYLNPKYDPRFASWRKRNPQY